ncbi:prepilin-type N-terminal cleavage/methylation domain-containing protein [Candidatus Pelagibacter communis]|uniref:prepilin-type N-terminal cleavage/methylation domain-containing protein n=1 Tax=Pelagibacter ubique TaxID=198252 RepID=UPI00065B4553|nr:prepilin-type N-terminal cleavage/methylation domain-containing protein [Candidatus Pelagibacter ubique]
MKKKEKGFSLLELMTTIGIISIIGAVGFPAIDNFGDQENYETDLATIRGQINYVRQLSLEDGNAYTIRIVNDTTNTTADLEVWQAQGLNRYNVEYHKSTATKCSDFDGTNDKGTKLADLTKKLEHMTISRCTSTTGNCTKVSASDNFFCFLPDGSSPENARGEMQSSSNAGGKKEYLHTYETGFFNNGTRM